MRRIAKCLLATALVALCTWIWFAPHLTVHAMRRAAQRGDAEALSSHVDFPALRASVRTQLAARVSDRLGGDSAWSRLGAEFATTLASPAIDAMVSPEALTLIFAGRDMHDRYATPERAREALAPEEHAREEHAREEPVPGEQAIDAPAGETTSSGGLDTSHWQLSMGYSDLSTFAVVVDTGRDTPAPTRLVFKRHKLLWWKLSGIELPAR